MSVAIVIDPGQLQRAAQCLDDSQHLRELHRRFTSLQLDNEAHPNPRGERQLRLGQAHAFTGCSQRRA